MCDSGATFGLSEEFGHLLKQIFIFLNDNGSAYLWWEGDSYGSNQTHF